MVELARELARHPAVHRVDLLTRQICDSTVHDSYSIPEECLQKGEGKFGGSFIVRLPCGPRDVYIRKEELWPHIREFADRGLEHAKKTLNSLGEAGEPCELYYIHGHYADAGEVAALMAQTLGVDMVLTGHSLGRNKLEHLLASGKQSLSVIESTYSIGRRIEAEERALDEAVMVITSTQQEIHDQWGLYHGYDGGKLHSVSRRRRTEYHMPLMCVVPPGLDFHGLKAPERHSDSKDEGDDPWSLTPVHDRPEPPIWREVFKFLSNPRKPVILALSRPDAKKNIATLVRAFGRNETLKELANLVLIMGNRNVIDSLPKGSKSVLMDVLKLVDAYDLYGLVAFPKRHRQDQVKDIYALAERTRGIFINPALQEPFGLTLIEASAYGVPIVATRHGGPVDIVATLENGFLVDPLSEEEIGNALVKILTEKNLWEEFSRIGSANIHAYSWKAHCEKSLNRLENEKRYIKSVQRITPMGGSWDDRYFRASLTDPSLEDFSAKSPKDVASIDDQAMRFDPESRRAEEERDSGRPRVATRTRLVVVMLDNSSLAGQALRLLKSIIASAYGRRSERMSTSKVGFGIASMLSLDKTSTLAEQSGVKVRHLISMPVEFVLCGALQMSEIDFVVCNSGADLFVRSSGTEMTSYEPYDVHIDERWNKDAIERVLERMWADRQKQKHLLSPVKIPTGHFHIVKEVAKKPVENIDDVATVDRVRAQLRRVGIRVGCTLQVPNLSEKTEGGLLEQSSLLG